MEQKHSHEEKLLLLETEWKMREQALNQSILEYKVQYNDTTVYMYICTLHVLNLATLAMTAINAKNSTRTDVRHFDC